MNSVDEAAVLLVEDDPNDILLFRRALTAVRPGAILEVAQDAEQAQAFLMRSESGLHALPAMTLLDLKLPGRSGMELLGWIRSRKALRSLVVVAFTSSREARDLRMAFDLCVNSYVVKPMGFEDLRAAVKMLCDYWINLNERPPVLPRGP